jgi:hypothetical protein
MTTTSEIAKLITGADPEVRKAIEAIFRIEKDNAYHKRPVQVGTQVLEAIREVVK